MYSLSTGEAVLVRSVWLEALGTTKNIEFYVQRKSATPPPPPAGGLKRGREREGDVEFVASLASQAPLSSTLRTAQDFRRELRRPLKDTVFISDSGVLRSAPADFPFVPQDSSEVTTHIIANLFTRAFHYSHGKSLNATEEVFASAGDLLINNVISTLDEARYEYLRFFLPLLFVSVPIASTCAFV